MSGPLRVMVRLGRFAPSVLRGIFRLNLRAMRGGGRRGHERMAASFPEPDRSLFQRPEVRDGFMACFQESCRQSARGPVWDVGLMGRPWGFDLAALTVKCCCGKESATATCPRRTAVISPAPCRPVGPRSTRTRRICLSPSTINGRS